MPTLVWSVAAHVALVAAICWRRLDWLGAQPPRPTVMTINLGGPPGPRAGGLTQTGARRAGVQPPEPPKPVPRRRRHRRRRGRRVASAKAAPARPSASASRRRPHASTAEPPREGSTRAETGARGPGLRTRHRAPAAPAASSSRSRTSAARCTCELVRTAIERGWERTPGTTGVTTVRFRILRDGTFDRVSIVQSSGNPSLDAAAARAISRVQTPPLPSGISRQQPCLAHEIRESVIWRILGTRSCTRRLRMRGTILAVVTAAVSPAGSGRGHDARDRRPESAAGD